MVVQAFPYFYVPYDDSFPDEPAQAQSFLRQLAQSLEAAMQQHQEPGAGRKQVVHAVQLVRAIPFYGYHPDERLFIKIVLYNPGQVTRIATLLQSGAIMNRAFQPHESHVPFLLQFKIDFNLYGMGLLRLGHVLFRHPVPTAQHTRHGWAESPVLAVPEGVSSPHSHSTRAAHSNQQANLTPASAAAHSQASRLWTASDIPSQWLWSNVPAGARLPERQSKCELEVDACVEDILNRQELVRMPLAEAGPEIRMVESLQSMWDEEKLRIGSSPPPPPPEPIRTPKPLCQHIEVVRAQLQAIVDEHKQEAAMQEAAQAQPPALSPSKADSSSQQIDQPQGSLLHTPAAATPAAATPAPAPASTPAGQPNTAAAAGAAPAVTPAANAVSSPAATPVPASLLRHTQAANLLTGSPLAATPASRAQTSGSSRQAEEAAGEGRPPAAAGMHAPSQATQNTEEADREIRELLAWMRQDEGSSDDEEADMLMALAEQAGPTPKSQSQQEVLQRLRQRRMSRLSHSQHEIEGILHCSEPSGGDISDSADELEDPAGHHPAAGPQPEMREPADQADIEDMGALANDLQDADMEEHQQLQHQQQHRQQHQQQAALDGDGAPGRQATGVFASEPGRSGWTQLLDSVDIHPPLAHQERHGPSSRNQPPAVLHAPATEPQQQQQQQPLQREQPLTLHEQTAEPQQDQQAMDFQYDSFSDSVEEGLVLVDSQPTPSNAEHLGPDPAEGAAHASAEQEQQQPQSSEAMPNQVPDSEQQEEQHPQSSGVLPRQVPHSEQQQLQTSRADVIPQADGAGDSDSEAPSAPNQQGNHSAAQQLAQNSHAAKSALHGQALPIIAAVRPGVIVSDTPTANAALAVAGPGPAGTISLPEQHGNQPEADHLPTAALSHPRPRRRRSRHVVQHAVLLAAAARHAMVAAGSPEAGNYSHSPLPGRLQSEPQLPSWPMPPTAPIRHFQSEPQLTEYGSDPDAGRTGGAMQAHAAEQQRVQLVHQTSSQHGAVGRQQDGRPSHHLSQATVAGPSGQAHTPSQVVSDSRATSDLLWNRQLHSQVLVSQPLHTRVHPSQVVSDSRASSEHRWMQGMQAHQTTSHPPSMLPERPSSQPVEPKGRAPNELVWEQNEGQPVTETDHAVVLAAAEAAAMPDDFDLVLSDSQPSPSHAAGPFLHSPNATHMTQHETAAQQSSSLPVSPEQIRCRTVDTPSSRPEHAMVDLKVHLPVAKDTLSAARQPEQPAGGAGYLAHATELGGEQEQMVALTVADTPVPAQPHQQPDQQLQQMPTFSTRLDASATASTSEALTPAMVPHAQARIQAQHGATPSLVVKDTPQSAAAAIPWSTVKDTPTTHTTPMHALLPQKFWLGSAQTPDQRAAADSTLLPAASGRASAANAPQTDGNTSSAAAMPPAQPQSQPETVSEDPEALPVPELTLRLSLSDTSSTRTPKAGLPSPGTDHRLPHTQTSSQVGLATALPPLLPFQSVHAQHPSPSEARLADSKPTACFPGSVTAADRRVPSTPDVVSSAPQLQAVPANAQAVQSIDELRLPASQPLARAAAALEDCTHTSTNPCSMGQVKRDLPLPNHFPVQTDASAAAHTASHGMHEPGAKHSSASEGGHVVNKPSGSSGGHEACDPLDDPMDHGSHDPDDQGHDRDNGHEANEPSNHPVGHASHDANDEGHERRDTPDDPVDHDSHSMDDPDDDDNGDEPDDPEPGSGTGYDLTEDLAPHRFKQRAPTQGELDVSMAEQSILPIIHPEAFYGNPADVPDRPVVLAGLEFKVPSSAVGNLPLFTRDTVTGGAGPMARLKAAASMRQQQQPLQQAPSTKLFKHVPARLPPSQKVINEWLELENPTHAAAAVAVGTSSISTAAQAAAGSGFVMDANTGRLVPLQSSATQNSEEDVPSSLLGTPYLATQTSHPRALMTTPRRLPPAPQQQDEQEEEEVRPASPKYDERSFFYTTPAAFKPAALSGRPQTQWATEGTFLGAVPHTVHPPSPHSSNQAALPAMPQQQQQQQLPAPASGARPSAGEQMAAGAMAPPIPRPAVFLGNRAAVPTAAAAVATAGNAASTAVGGANKRQRFVSQITPPSPASGMSGPTPVSQAGFRRLVPGKGQQLTLLSLEVHADTRGSLLPDPRYDAVRAIVLAVMDDVEECPDGLYTARLMLFDDSGKAPKDAMNRVQVEVFQSEKALLEAFVEATQSLDPDIILGFEVQKGSLGYLADRGATMEMALLKLVSRTPEMLSPKDRQNDEYGALHASGIHCTGRIVLNVWRILRSELKLNIYTFESCVAAVLQLRTPHVQPHVLTQWFNAGPAGGRWRCLQYWLRRTRLNLALLEQLDLIGRTAELARAFGIDFFSVLSRGSQYRVESMMVRLAHTQNYLMLSPAKEQVANQPAMEAVPLILEPESRFYTDPVLVLDFQSLYPSIIIAYNLCYSTVVGRPAHAAAAGQEVKLGAANYAVPPGTLTGPNAPHKLVIAANGVAYLPHEARAGIVPRLLQEILSTRIMVKGAMKGTPASHKVLQRVMNARQFGLKLIANVTYGYTSAGFSGRMPMAEIADSIVQSARETLENAIRMVEASDKWKARVVYGDTDSMFVLLPGRSREEAFRIGAEIAREVTASNPPPVTLKFEKVYHPCVLLTKKRYVGYMYETPSQVAPGFDAKGIETVRRDTCPAVAKTMERSLRLLFATRDLSEVKEYLERQWRKILANRVSVQDFVFAKEVRLGTYSPKAAVVPPAAIVAAKAMATDPRAEPRFAERVPYVVVYGEPGARLVDMVVSPHALVESSSRLRLHSIYYITKQIIPALERIFSLVGADLRAWFAAMPRPLKLLPQKRPQGANALREGPAMQHLGPGRAAGIVGTIDRYYLSRHCAVCDGLTHAAQPLCDQCQQDPQLAAAVLTARSGRLERQYVQLVRICLHCNGGGGRHIQNGGIVCDSLDCGVYYERRKVAHELAAAAALAQAGLALLD